MEVKALFRRTVDTGLVHGTVTVMLGGEGFEVTTYRIDGEYEDSRHPKEVVFTGELREDLRRRDFTINAMAYNDREGLVDAFGGIRDLEKGIIRCVGMALMSALRKVRHAHPARSPFCGPVGICASEEPDKKGQPGSLPLHLQKSVRRRLASELTKLLDLKKSLSVENSLGDGHHCCCPSGI